jgi:hypothetical protein
LVTRVRGYKREPFPPARTTPFIDDSPFERNCAYRLPELTRFTS